MPDALLQQPVAIFLTIMAVLLITPLLSERVHLPGIVGIILGGMLVGPHGINLLTSAGAIELLATVGLLYLMFSAGMEVDLRQFNRVRNKALLFGFLTFTIPLLMGAALGRWLLGMDWLGAVLLGSAFSSHTLIALPILSRLGLVNNEGVAVTVGATLLSAIAAFLLLAVIIGLSRGDVSPVYFVQLVVLSAIYTVIVLAGIPRIGKAVLRRLTGRELEFQFVLVVLLIAAYLAELVGIHSVVGAFLAGLAINATLPHHSPVIGRVLFVGEAFFIPLFVLYSGMITDPMAFIGSTETILYALGITVVAYLSKFIAAWIATRFFNYTRDEFWIIFGLSQAQAAVTIPTLIIGVELGLFSETVFNASIMMILLTSITSPMIVQRFALRLKPPVVDQKQAQPFERILLPIEDPEVQEHLITLCTVLARSDNGVLIPLHVAREVDGRAVGLDIQQEILHSPLFDDPDTRIEPVGRVDSSLAKGILRTAAEKQATLIALAWDGRPTFAYNFLGNVHDLVAFQSSIPVMVARMTTPINAIDRVSIVVPPDNFSAAAARQALRLVEMIAEEINVTLTIFVAPRYAQYLNDEFVSFKTDHPCEIVRVEGDIVKAIREYPDTGDDLIVVATAGSARRFRSTLGRIPEALAQSTQASIVVLRYT